MWCAAPVWLLPKSNTKSGFFIFHFLESIFIYPLPPPLLASSPISGFNDFQDEIHLTNTLTCSMISPKLGHPMSNNVFRPTAISPFHIKCFLFHPFSVHLNKQKKTQKKGRHSRKKFKTRTDSTWLIPIRRIHITRYSRRPLTLLTSGGGGGCSKVGIMPCSPPPLLSLNSISPYPPPPSPSSSFPSFLFPFIYKPQLFN